MIGLPSKGRVITHDDLLSVFPPKTIAEFSYKHLDVYRNRGAGQYCLIRFWVNVSGVCGLNQAMQITGERLAEVVGASELTTFFQIEDEYYDLLVKTFLL